MRISHHVLRWSDGLKWQDCINNVGGIMTFEICIAACFWHFVAWLNTLPYLLKKTVVTTTAYLTECLIIHYSLHQKNSKLKLHTPSGRRCLASDGILLVMGREAENNWQLEVFTADYMNYWDKILHSDSWAKPGILKIAVYHNNRKRNLACQATNY